MTHFVVRCPNCLRRNVLARMPEKPEVVRFTCVGCEQRIWAEVSAEQLARVQADEVAMGGRP